MYPIFKHHTQATFDLRPLLSGQNYVKSIFALCSSKTGLPGLSGGPQSVRKVNLTDCFSFFPFDRHLFIWTNPEGIKHLIMSKKRKAWALLHEKIHLQS